MWQVFYGQASEGGPHYLHEYEAREDAEWFAEDKYWDLHKCFGAYAVAVNLCEGKATVWGDFIPFAGEFDADFRDEPEFFGPHRFARTNVLEGASRATRTISALSAELANAYGRSALHTGAITSG